MCVVGGLFPAIVSLPPPSLEEAQSCKPVTYSDLQLSLSPIPLTRTMDLRFLFNSFSATRCQTNGFKMANFMFYEFHLNIKKSITEQVVISDWSLH